MRAERERERGTVCPRVSQFTVEISLVPPGTPDY
jgi:hypothetical protein